MGLNREWTVLLIGGASGMGKSKLAYQLANTYQVNVMEIDDIYQAVKSMTTGEMLPAVHYWSTGIDWMDVGVSGNVKWLIDVSTEMMTGLRAIIDNHLDSDIPIIIEGDFLSPEFAASFDHSKVKVIYVNEQDKHQIVQNYLAREGGDLQYFRADISYEYGNWLINACDHLGIHVVEARPWATTVERIKTYLAQ